MHLKPHLIGFLGRYYLAACLPLKAIILSSIDMQYPGSAFKWQFLLIVFMNILSFPKIS